MVAISAPFFAVYMLNDLPMSPTLGVCFDWVASHRHSIYYLKILGQDFSDKSNWQSLSFDYSLVA